MDILMELQMLDTLSWLNIQCKGCFLLDVMIFSQISDIWIFYVILYLIEI